MIASFDVPDSERHLYFLLNNTFHLHSPLSSSTYKFAGLYSIHHDGKCRYVGQSQNLPSRLANHLSGHYSYADEFRVYFVPEYGFDDFFERTKASRKKILETNELKLIQHLKPVDNIIANYDREIPEECLFDSMVNYIDQRHCLEGFKSEFFITITDCAYMAIIDMDERVIAQYNENMEEIGRAINGQI